jgi:CPA2 family monovalent cation:H+ antiporter-2
MVLSESDHAHQALSDVIPLRDIFGLLFFVSVGMLLEPRFVQENLLLVLGLVGMVSLTKGLVCAGLGWAFGYRNVIPLALGLTMFQAGEFAFVIGRVGVGTGSIGTDMYATILSVALVTMFLTPFVSRATAPIYGFVRRRRREEPVLTINIAQSELHDHVVMAGAGQTGRAVAGVLRRLDLPGVAIELDQHRLETCRDAGLAVIYGDASHPLVLKAAGLDRARVLLITTPSPVVTRAIAQHVRELRPDLHIIARAETEELMEELYELGVHKVVLPQMEAGLEVTRQALLHLQVPDQQIERFSDEVRREFYRPLREDEGK